MDNSYIEIRSVTKALGGNTVLDNVSLVLPRGSVTGLRGHNGSGKTMLLRAIAGLITLDSGEITIEGKRLGRDISFPPSMGLIVENSGVWGYMTGLDCLCMIAEINKIISKTEVREAIKRVGLNPDDKRKFRKYSLGMKRRLMIAQAIMEKPDLLLLDEPTNALDPGGVDLAHDILAAEKARGATIVLASHVDDKVMSLCDKVCSMANGRLEEARE
ncbi:MAG: ABC transporter ATP-binding protein [Oscillospiraceae bacterium]|jgi:ABC-2 type transport system ATP-binding protein|nr:ABC transporter ATP-binding protein [Oscillospiraceae bacterium]